MEAALDKYGISTLEAIAHAPAFNRWTYDTIRPFCTGHIIELGSGIGNISQFFIRENQDIVLSDLRGNYRDYLRDKFQLPEPNVRSVDMVHPDFNEEYSDLIETFDTAFALNVVEHIENHRQAVCNASLLLKPGGKLIILVPAYPWLFNRFDRELGHFTRFTRQSLTALLPEEMQLLQCRYFNAIGIPGWFFSGSVMRRKEIGSGAMKIFNQLMPLVKLTDAVLFHSVGLSVWFVAEKKISG